MNNQIQLVLKSSTTELSLNDRELGIYLTPELDGLTGLPEIRTTSGVNAGYDGGWTSAQNYDARSITIRGVIANEDVATVEQLRRQLTTLAGQGKNEELTLDLVTQAGKAYTIQVRTIALEMSLQKVLTQQEFMLQLRADDPLIYDASETTHEALLQVAQATGGFTINFELPLAITGSSEETIVNNEGLEQVPTVTRMYGELHNPKIINQTTNQFMQIEADLGFAEGDWITPSEPVEGKDLTINGAPNNAPLSDFKLKGDTYQQTYSGKNKSPNVGEYTFLQNNATITSTSSDSITLSLTASAYSGVYIDKTSGTSICPEMFQSGYTFSCTAVASSNITMLFGTSGHGQTASVGTTKTRISAQLYGGNLILYSSSATTATLTLSDFQVESGSTATAYEPYVGGIPAPNPDYPQAVQTVTGENVVKICGKNLFDSSKIIVGDIQNANTTIRLHSSQILWLEAGTYTFSTNLPTPLRYSISTTDKGYPPYATWPTWDYNSSWQDSERTTTFTLTKGGYFNVQFSKLNNATLTPDEFTPYNYQLELGSTATAYEPYQGQSYEVNLGKNLISSAWETGAYSSSTGEKTSGSTSTRTADYIPVERNSTYIASVDGSGLAMNIYSYDINKNFLGHQFASNGSSFTTGLNTRFITMARSANVDVTKIQLEKGSSITSYAAYFEPIELCKIGDYQDYIYKNLTDNKWYVHKAVDKIVYDGSQLAWVSYASGSNTVFYQEISNTAYGSATSNPIMSDRFKSEFAANNGNIYLSGSTHRINFCTNVANNPGAWVAWLTANPTTAYYALATPTDTEITNAALVAQLEAILSQGKTYAGTNNITTLYAEGNEQPTLDVSYFTDKNPDTRDELVIDSRLRTITLNGLDVYHLQAPGSEFLMLAPGENRLSLQSDITGDNGYAQVSYKQGYLSI